MSTALRVPASPRAVYFALQSESAGAHGNFAVQSFSAEAVPRLPGWSAAAAPAELRRRQGALRRHVQREGAALLNQQCWLWGCDIRREGGNLLLQHGFERTRPPAGQERSTQYTAALPGGRVVRLWGSGLYFGTAAEGLYLNRFLPEPRHATFTEDWQDPAVLRRGPRHWHHGLLYEAFHWLAAYESWVAAETTPAYRQGCLASFAGSVSRPGGIADAWQQLAETLAP